MKFKRKELNKLSDKTAKEFLKSEIGKQNIKELRIHMNDFLVNKISQK